MATIRKLRGRWQAQVRRRGVAPRAKSFNTKADAQRWAQDLEAEANRSGWVADTLLAEKTTLRELLTRYSSAEMMPRSLMDLESRQLHIRSKISSG
jgi:hypothetical protein